MSNPQTIDCEDCAGNGFVRTVNGREECYCVVGGNNVTNSTLHEDRLGPAKGITLALLICSAFWAVVAWIAFF